MEKTDTKTTKTTSPMPMTKAAEPKETPTEAKEPPRWINGMMTCKANGCSAKLMIRGTNKINLGDGRILIERSVKCQGPNRHSYVHTETVRVPKK
jgi:hypothetical protein